MKLKAAIFGAVVFISGLANVQADEDIKWYMVVCDFSTTGDDYDLQELDGLWITNHHPEFKRLWNLKGGACRLESPPPTTATSGTGALGGTSTAFSMPGLDLGD